MKLRDSEASAPPARLSGLQILRGVAAMLVVVFHLGRTAHFQAGLDDAATLVGAAGVDLFFVISGFIMIHTTRRGLAPGAFLRRRLARIAPLYGLATLLAFGLAGLAPRAAGSEPLWRLAAALTFFPSFNAKGEIAPVFEPGWTLQYEAFFYVVLALASALSFRRRLAILSAALLGAVAAGALDHVTPFALPAPLACWTDPLLLEFLAGCLIARLHAAGRLALAPAAAAALILLGAALLLVAATAAAARPHWIEHWRWLAWGGPAAAIVAGVASLERRVDFSRFSFAVRLGDSSYALYLSHVFVVAAAGQALRLAPSLLATNAADLLAPVGAAAFCGALAVGSFVHARIETPLTSAHQANSAAQGQSASVHVTKFRSPRRESGIDGI
jgi:exopolysaccharide production protein ExoZ